jgi:hypothetical protein
MASIATMLLRPEVMLTGWSVLFMVLQQMPGDTGRKVCIILAVSLEPLLLSEDRLARNNGFSQVITRLGMRVSILTAGWVVDVIGVSNTVIMRA